MLKTLHIFGGKHLKLPGNSLYRVYQVSDFLNSIPTPSRCFPSFMDVSFIHRHDWLIQGEPAAHIFLLAVSSLFSREHRIPLFQLICKVPI